jgi:hypothetical protein
MNPYVGLEQFISFKHCGVEKGNIITIAQFEKLSKEEQQKMKDDKYTWEDKNGKWYGFVPKSTARNYVVRHLNGTVPAKQLFTSEVFTDEVIDLLDQNIIKPTFVLPDIGEINENFDTLLDEPLFDEETQEDPLGVKIEHFLDD